MARRKKKGDGGGGEGGSAALARMQLLSTYIAACNDQTVKERILSLANGEHLYGVFVEALNDKVEDLFDAGAYREVVEDAALRATDRLGHLAEQIAALSDQVGTLTNDRLFAVLNVVNRNFGGAPIPAFERTPKVEGAVVSPPPSTAPVASEPAAPAALEKPKATLRKRFAASGSREAVEDRSNGGEKVDAPRVVAPPLPPRGNNIIGL